MSEKVFIDANELFVDSYRLARKIFDDGFRPDYVVGVWRGGCPIGVAVEEFLRAHPTQPLLPTARGCLSVLQHTERHASHSHSLSFPQPSLSLAPVVLLTTDH